MGSEKLLFQNVDLNEVAKTDDTLKLINRDFTETYNKFLYQMGLNMSKIGDPIPESGGVPRMFIMKDGKIRTFKEEDIVFGSREFWQTAALGQVFIYPAGEKHPVQMQMKAPTAYSDIKLQFSKPLDPDNLPDIEMPAPPAKPRWYHRMFKFGKNKNTCQKYDDYVAKQAQLKAMVKSFAQTVNQEFGKKRTVDFREGEKLEKDLAVKALEEKKAIKDAVKNLQSVNADIVRVENGVKNAMRMYGPSPEIVPGLIIKDRKKTDNRTGLLYTEEEFAKLKPINIDGLKVGEQQITPQEFASLAFCAGIDPKIGLEAQQIAGDPSFAIEALKKDGFTQAEAEEFILVSSREMYGRSLIKHRADTGVYIEPAIQPAREKTLEALQAYQNGDKQPMAEILARAAFHIGNDNRISSTMEFSLLAQNQLVCNAMDMMERDPELKNMARQAYEQQEAAFNSRHPEYRKAPSFDGQLATIRQIKKMNDLSQKSLTAKKTLLQAQADGKTNLSAEEKHALVKDIIKYETARFRYEADINLTLFDRRSGFSKEYHALLEHADKLPKEAGVFGAKSKSGTSSAPVTADTFLLAGLTARTVPKPEILDTLDKPDMMSQMDKAIDNLIKKEDLANASVKHIIDKLVTNDSRRDFEYAGDKLMTKIIMANPNTGKQQAAPQPQVPVKKAEVPAEQPKENLMIGQ